MSNTARINKAIGKAIRRHMSRFHNRMEAHFIEPEDGLTLFSGSKSAVELVIELEGFALHMLPKELNAVAAVLGQCSAIGMAENEKIVSIARSIVAGADAGKAGN